LEDFEYVRIILDGIGILDYFFEKRLFDKVWLINKYRVLIESSILISEIESIHDPSKRRYFLKAFDLIPINQTLRVKAGPDGFLDAMSAPWRPKPDEKVSFINSLIRDKKVTRFDASKMPWLLNCRYLVTAEKNISEIIELCKSHYGREYPEIVSPLKFEQLIDGMLKNDEYCKYHSKDTLIPLSKIEWP
jgi:hypothetical protein